jgi:hypothetical protein
VINLAKLRNESKNAGGKKAFVAGKGGRKGKFGRRRSNSKTDGEKKERDPAKRQEQLDKEMEAYWMKGGHTEMGKY